MHDHVPGWKLCDRCGRFAPLDCPTCAQHHETNHHARRRARRIKKEATR